MPLRGCFLGTALRKDLTTHVHVQQLPPSHPQMLNTCSQALSLARTHMTGQVPPVGDPVRRGADIRRSTGEAPPALCQFLPPSLPPVRCGGDIRRSFTLSLSASLAPILSRSPFSLSHSLPPSLLYFSLGGPPTFVCGEKGGEESGRLPSVIRTVRSRLSRTSVGLVLDLGLCRTLSGACDPSPSRACPSVPITSLPFTTSCHKGPHEALHPSLLLGLGLSVAKHPPHRVH